MIKLALIDHHPVVQKGFKFFFKKNENIKLCGTFLLIDEFLDYIKEMTVDVVLMEMNLPEKNIIETIYKIKILLPEVFILIYTSLPEEKYKISILKAGASGYISKKVSQKILTKVIEKVVKLEYFITSNFDEQLNRNFNLSFSKKRHSFLSSRELEVLNKIINGKRNFEISQDLGISQKTVNTYKSRLMKKLQVKNDIDLFQQAKNLKLF